MSQYMYQMNGLDIEHAELNKLVEDLTEKAEKAASRNKCESSKQSSDYFVQEKVVQAFLCKS